MMNLPVPDSLVFWLTHYGSFALFALLALGIFALPIPDETLMVFAGILIFQQKILPVPTMIAAICGAILGITLSYLIGRTAGAFLLKKYGKWIGITERKLKHAHAWFERFGRWGLLIGYFVPGLRHFTGYAAGVTILSYNQFAMFAYTGALIWSMTFLSIGYFLGNKWVYLMELVEDKWYNAAIVLAAIVIGMIAWQMIKRRKSKKKPS